MGQAQSGAAAPAASREELEHAREAYRGALAAGSTERARALLEAHPALIYVHTKDGLNVWHLAAQSGDPKVCCT